MTYVRIYGAAGPGSREPFQLLHQGQMAQVPAIRDYLQIQGVMYMVVTLEWRLDEDHVALFVATENSPGDVWRAAMKSNS